jgi:ABC-2 type transport system ATP-binding protein
VARLVELLAGPGVSVTSTAPQWLEVTGSTAQKIGEVAAAAQLVLHELTPVNASLEDAYMALTQESVEYHSTGAGLTGLHPDPNHSGAPLALSGTEGQTR